MSTQKLVIKARIEEVPTLANFTLTSLQRDLTDFSTYKPAKYDPGFIPAYQAKQLAVNNIINPLQYTAELQVITARIFQNTIALRPMLDRIEGYIADASPLTIAPKNFGISTVRKNINKDDQEALSGSLVYLITNLTNNMAALVAQGYTTTQHNAIKGLTEEIDQDNTAQNAKISARALLVVNNYSTINELAQMMKDIWADGKRLYKTGNKTKLNDYTNTKLLDRIRQEALRTKLIGLVTDTNGNPMKEVKLKAKPVTGGRSKTIKPLANGNFEFKGLQPVPLNITVTAKDKAPYLVQATPITNQTVTLNIQVP